MVREAFAPDDMTCMQKGVPLEKLHHVADPALTSDKVDPLPTEGSRPNALLPTSLVMADVQSKVNVEVALEEVIVERGGVVPVGGASPTA